MQDHQRRASGDGGEDGRARPDEGDFGAAGDGGTAVGSSDHGSNSIKQETKRSVLRRRPLRRTVRTTLRVVAPPLLRLGDRGLAGVRHLIAMGHQALAHLPATGRLVSTELGDVGLASLPHAEAAAATGTAGSSGGAAIGRLGKRRAGESEESHEGEGDGFGRHELNLQTRRRPGRETEPPAEGA
jgi:hypothetical protein